jgi:uncharacterized protein YbjT (DUF2867 family)
MNVLILGATGMVGQGVLRECLHASDVESVVSVGRSRLGVSDPKLTSVVIPDLFDLQPAASQLTDIDACFCCLGVSSTGMSAEAYERVTHDLTVAIATTVAASSPDAVFTYVSGAGTSETSRMRWARVKGRTERELMELFPRAYMFRPGFIQPLHGIRSRTRFYRLAYAASGPLVSLLRRLSPRLVSTTEDVGLAMLTVARSGAPKKILDNGDIHALAHPS